MAWLVCVRVPTSLIGRFSSATTRMTCEVSLDLSLELLPRFPFSPLPIEFYEQLLGFTGLYWVLPSLNEFSWHSPSSNRFYLVFTGFYWVSMGFTGFYWVSPGFTGFYLILLGFLSDVIIFTEFYWVLLGFTGF